MMESFFYYMKSFVKKFRIIVWNCGRLEFEDMNNIECLVEFRVKKRDLLIFVEVF